MLTSARAKRSVYSDLARRWRNQASASSWLISLRFTAVLRGKPESSLAKAVISSTSAKSFLASSGEVLTSVGFDERMRRAKSPKLGAGCACCGADSVAAMVLLKSGCCGNAVIEMKTGMARKAQKRERADMEAP